MRTARRIKRAGEELKHVNREARRVHTSIADEDTLFSDVLQELQDRKDPILGAVRHYVRRRRAVNAHILAYLRRLYSLDGFTGIPTPGSHAGPPRESRQSLPTAHSPMLSPAADLPLTSIPTTSHAPADSLESRTEAELAAVDKDDSEEGLQVDEDEDGAVSDLVDLMSNIAVVM